MTANGYENLQKDLKKLLNEVKFLWSGLFSFTLDQWSLEPWFVHTIFGSMTRLS